MAILVSVHGPEERGAVLGVNAAMVYVGLSVGPSLGGFLTTSFGWRSIFLVNVGVGLLIIATTMLKVRAEWAEGASRSFDIGGSAMYSLMLLALMYGMSMLPNTAAYPFILGGLVLLCAFIYYETRVENPILDVNLFLSNRAFSFSNLAAFINFSATYAVTLLLSLYLQYIKALDAQQAGIVMMASPITQAIISPLAGRLSDRVEPYKIASVGMAVTTLSLLPFMFLGESTPLTYVAGSLALLGLGLIGIFYLATACVEIVLGFLLGFSLIAKYTGEKGEKIFKAVSPFQGIFGIIAILLGLFWLLTGFGIFNFLFFV